MLQVNSGILVNLFFSRTSIPFSALVQSLLGHNPSCCLPSSASGWMQKIPWSLLVASWLDGLQDTCHEAHTWWPIGHPLLWMLLFSPWAVLATEFHLAEVLGHTPQHWCHLLSLFSGLVRNYWHEWDKHISYHVPQLSIPATPQERERILRTTGKLKSPHSVTFLTLQSQG